MNHHPAPRAITLCPGDGQSMIESGGIVKPMPSPAPGTSWAILKNSAQIPYVTDGVTKKWCMSFFQVTQRDPSSSGMGELPSLDVDDSTAPPTGNRVPPPIAALPGNLVRIKMYQCCSFSLQSMF